MRSVFLTKRQNADSCANAENDDFEESDRQVFLVGLKTSYFDFQKLPELVERGDFAELTYFLHKFSDKTAEIFQNVAHLIDCNNPRPGLLKFLVNASNYYDFAYMLRYMPYFDTLIERYAEYNEDDFDSLLLLLFNAIQDMKGLAFTSFNIPLLVLDQRFSVKKIQVNQLGLLLYVLYWRMQQFALFEGLFDNALELQSKTALYYVLMTLDLFIAGKSANAARFFISRLQRITGAVLQWNALKLHQLLIWLIYDNIRAFKKQGADFSAFQRILFQIGSISYRSLPLCVSCAYTLMECEEMFPDEFIVYNALLQLQSANQDDVGAAIAFFAYYVESFKMIDQNIIDAINAVKLTEPRIAAELADFWSSVATHREDAFSHVSERLLQYICDAEFASEDAEIIECFLDIVKQYLENSTPE